MKKGEERKNMGAKRIEESWLERKGYDEEGKGQGKGRKARKGE